MPQSGTPSPAPVMPTISRPGIAPFNVVPTIAAHTTRSIEEKAMDTDKKPKPIESGTGKQKDDNIDDLGRRPGGARENQPGATKPSKGGGSKKASSFEDLTV